MLELICYLNASCMLPLLFLLLRSQVYGATKAHQPTVLINGLKYFFFYQSKKRFGRQFFRYLKKVLNAQKLKSIGLVVVWCKMVEQGRSLAETPNWAVATVITFMVTLGFFFHTILKQFGKVNSQLVDIITCFYIYLFYLEFVL